MQACAIAIDSNEIEILSGMRGGEATRDGRHRVYHQRGEIWIDDGEGEPELFHTSAGALQWPVLSPGEEFVVFGSDTTARGAITLKRFPTGSGEWQIHSEGGDWHRWNPAGDELYFSNDGALYVMAIETGDEVSFDAPRRLFSEGEQGLICGLGYDIDAKGERILCLRSESNELPTATLVQSWYSEFDARREAGSE